MSALPPHDHTRIAARFALTASAFLAIGFVLVVLLRWQLAADGLLDQAATLAGERRMAHVELRHIRPKFPALPSKTHKVAMRLPLASDAAAAWTGRGSAAS